MGAAAMLDSVDIVRHSRTWQLLQAFRRGRTFQEPALARGALVRASDLAVLGFCPEAHRIHAPQRGRVVSARQRGRILHARRARRLRRSRRVAYADVEPEWHLLVHPESGVCGRPDVVVAVRVGLWRRELRPREYKSGDPRRDLGGPVLQLMAQGLLVESEYGSYPRVGYLEFEGYRVLRIRLGHAARCVILEILEAIHAGQCHPIDVPLEPVCFTCSHRGVCRVLATHLDP